MIRLDAYCETCKDTFPADKYLTVIEVDELLFECIQCGDYVAFLEDTIEKTNERYKYHNIVLDKMITLKKLNKLKEIPSDIFNIIWSPIGIHYWKSKIIEAKKRNDHDFVKEMMKLYCELSNYASSRSIVNYKKQE